MTFLSKAVIILTLGLAGCAAPPYAEQYPYGYYIDLLDLKRPATCSATDGRTTIIWTCK